MAKKMVSFRCETELLEAFQSFCDANETNLTEQLTGFMESVVNTDVNTDVNTTVHTNVNTSNDNCNDKYVQPSIQLSLQEIIEARMVEIEARLEKKLNP